jgi:hypothetical protein
VFAGAAREAVFSRPEVVRRVNEEFIPVALKAAMVNNPPSGLEGALYGELGRSKPAPQGICVANSAGKVLDWVLMFDDDSKILAFLDHALSQYLLYSDAEKPVPARRFMRFPSQELDVMADTTGKLQVADGHQFGSRCPAQPLIQDGTLVGRIIGRPLDQHGDPVADTLRQEHYMEARFDVPTAVQEAFAAELNAQGAGRFRVPDPLSMTLVSHAYLGQLDVNPMGTQPGGNNHHRQWEFWAQRKDSGDSSMVRVRIEGTSHVTGGSDKLGRQTDGRRWGHEVKLEWVGYVDVDTQHRRFRRLVALAKGNELLTWGNTLLINSQEPDVAHLPAGHPIDLHSGVRYGLLAEHSSAN